MQHVVFTQSLYSHGEPYVIKSWEYSHNYYDSAITLYK
jgi:hypothetical protein